MLERWFYAVRDRDPAEADVVVIMTMMRTLLGRHVREALNDPPRPWVLCGDG